MTPDTSAPYACGMLEIDFLVGETVIEVRKDYRIVFDVGADPAPRLYADVIEPRLCLDSDHQPLSLACLVGRTVASASTAGGVLSLAFTDGATVRCDLFEDFEAWQVVSTQPKM